jgi:hypothetical protein
MKSEEVMKEFEEWYDKWLFHSHYPFDDKKLFMQKAWLEAFRRYGKKEE